MTHGSKTVPHPQGFPPRPDCKLFNKQSDFAWGVSDSSLHHIFRGKKKLVSYVAGERPKNATSVFCFSLWSLIWDSNSTNSPEIVKLPYFIQINWKRDMWFCGCDIKKQLIQNVSRRKGDVHLSPSTSVVQKNAVKLQKMFLCSFKTPISLVKTELLCSNNENERGCSAEYSDLFDPTALAAKHHRKLVEHNGPFSCTAAVRREQNRTEDFWYLALECSQKTFFFFLQGFPSRIKFI